VLRYPSDASDYDKRLEIRGPLHHQVRGCVQTILAELGTELVVLGATGISFLVFHRWSSAKL